MLTRVLGLVLGFLIVGVTVGHAQTAPPPIPELASWEQKMLQFGDKHCQMLQNSSVSFDEKLAGNYYDAERVYYQIADYTKDNKWLNCARAAEQIYRDSYVFGNNGKIPGYWVFPHGMWKDFKRTQDTRSKDGLIILSKNAAYAQDTFELGRLSDPELSREVAYNLQAKMLAKDLGDASEASITRLAEEAFRHMDAWFVSKTAPYIRPFMVALTSEALIMYYNRTGDTRVLPTLKMAWTDLWARTWIPSCLCFMYTDRQWSTGGTEPAPDLNLLIAPAFGWLYYMTGDPIWQQRGDQIFVGGVRQAFMAGAKQFNQSYRWSFDYVTYRKKSNATFVTFGSTPPPPTGGGSTPPPSGDSGGSDGGSSTPPPADDGSNPKPPSVSPWSFFDGLSKMGPLRKR